MTGRQPIPARGASAFLARQFGAPSGLAGHVVTRLLARGNGRFNRWLVNEISTALPVPHTVIELGYGPGIALHEILRRYPVARVIGVDPSPAARKSAGLYIAYYPSAIHRVQAVDPATLGRTLAARRLAGAISVEFAGLDGQHRPVDSDSVDHVPAT